MKFKNRRGFTLIELTIVVAIVGILASVIFPHFDLVLQKANQAKSRGNLAELRSALSLYYTDNTFWPFGNYPQGTSHITDGISLSEALIPKYINKFATPRLVDRMSSFNGLNLSYDGQAKEKMNMNPPEDVVIWWGPQDYRPGLNIPYVYDNFTGTIYYNNGNYDTKGDFFFTW